MNNIIPGKMIFHRIINNSTKKNTINIEKENNYLDDLRKELEQDLNKKKIFKLYNKDTNIIENKDTNIIENKDTDVIENKDTDVIENKDTDVIEINKKSKRDIFFKNIKSTLQERKFIILRENNINAEVLQNSSKSKLGKNINKKYNFRILDLINYYDLNYKIFKVNSNERSNQDKFYNNIKYFNILEFYPNNGCYSCLINNKLEYSDKHIVIQNNNEYMKIIEDNKNNHNSFFNIININPENINISEYLVNCIIFNNISNDNYTTIFNIINNNLENLKNNILDIYFEKIDNYDISPLYQILESISFINKLSEENREQWINNN